MSVVSAVSTLEYLEALMGQQNSRALASGLCGRIIRGKNPKDFTTLTDDPHRKLVMLMGSDGLEMLLGKSGQEMLEAIGYEATYIIHKVQEGNQFKLVVFPEGGGFELATWDNVIDVVGSVYPDVVHMLRASLDELKSTPFDQIEMMAGYDMSEVDKIGKAHHQFMTHERFIQSAGGLVEVRAFLYFTIHLRELFSGDGYTYDNNGKQSLMEYIGPNKAIAEITGSQLVDIEVSLTQGGNQAMPTITQPKQTTRLPMPAFFKASDVGKIRQVKYHDVAAAARDFAAKYSIKPAAIDKLNVELMIIDAQNTFCIPTGELFVGGRGGNGAVEDNERLCRFIYGNLDKISQIAVTMDTHFVMQIFHEMFLVDQQGNHPAPMTMITLDDVLNGRWRVNPGIAHSVGHGNYVALQQHLVHYVKKLSANGKYALVIWPYHAMLGGVGHALVASIEEACFFHNLARNAQTDFQIKGGNFFTENYSVLKPEVLDKADGSVLAQKNAKFIETLLRADRVIIAGQAKSHCVAWTIADLLDEINAKDPKLAKKVYLLEDCTSPVVVPGVVDFTDQGNEAFQRFKDAGMHVVQSTDPIDSWLA